MPIPHTYRVIGKIGAGNSGEIYKAYQINLGKYVVLKKIKTEIKDFLNTQIWHPAQPRPIQPELKARLEETSGIKKD